MNKYLIPIVVLICTLITGCDSEKEPVARQASASQVARATEGTIIALGDSLTAGLGLDLEKSYPARLQRRLEADGYNYRVVNAGVSGETTSGTLSRLSWILAQKPDIVIVEIGANDGLSGIDIALIDRNLHQILAELKKNNVITIFTGMKMVLNLGVEYTTRFNRIYSDLAAEKDVIYMPFFLEGVATVSELNREDGIHPNEKGYGVITENLYPYVIQAIKKHRSRRG
jgi:acyl-CoA thioesterase-1